MYKKICIVVVAAVFVMDAGLTHAQKKSGELMALLKKSFENYSMDYTMTYTMPSGKQHKVVGVTARRNDAYYFDSSNARYVLVNQNWYVNADHQSKMISIAYIPALQKSAGKGGMIPTGQAMFSDQELMKKVKIVSTKEKGDTAWVTMSGDKAFNVEGIMISYLKSTYYPLSITVSMSVANPMDETNDSPAALYKVTFQGSRIVCPASDIFFDDRKLIKVEAGKAHLTKFNHYKTFKSKIK